MERKKDQQKARRRADHERRGDRRAGQRRAGGHVRILRELSQVLANASDLDVIFQTAVNTLSRVTGHEVASLHLLDEGGTTLVLRGERGLSPELRRLNQAVPIGRGLIGRVVATGDVLRVADLRTSADLLPAARAIVAREGWRAFVSVPIRSHGRVRGALSLGRRGPKPLSASETALLEAVANQVGMVLENAELTAEARRLLDTLRQAEDHLVEGAKLSAVAKLASGLVHEIENPLAVILGQAELMLLRPEQDVMTDRLRVVIQETSRAGHLLQDLLEFARQQPPVRRPCSLPDIVQTVLDLMRHDLDHDRIELVVESAPVRDVWADKGQIQQVLLNLIQNARDAMREGHEPRALRIDMYETPGHIRAEISDTGPGIPSDVLPRIFDAFFTTKPPGEGSGLGLWMSHAIVEQHGGRLLAEDRPGGGARFIVELRYSEREA